MFNVKYVISEPRCAGQIGPEPKTLTSACHIAVGYQSTKVTPLSNKTFLHTSIQFKLSLTGK